MPKFIFIKLEKKSHNAVLPEPSRRSRPAASCLRGALVCGMCGWTGCHQPLLTPEAFAFMKKQSGYVPKTLISGEGRSNCKCAYCCHTAGTLLFCTCSKPENYPLFIFFPQRTLREWTALACRWMSWFVNDQGNKHYVYGSGACRNATTVQFSFCFANPSNRTWCLLHVLWTDWCTSL